MHFDLNLALSLLPDFVDGFLTTMALLVPAFVLGLALSIPLALARRSRKASLRVPSLLYTAFMRGAPQLALLYLVYNGFPRLAFVRETLLWEFFRNPFNCALFVMTLNHAAFMVEVWRGALDNLPKGLVEAGLSLGLSRSKRFVFIEMPLAFRLGLPAYRNEVVLFLKGTAAVGAITIFDILGVARQAVDKTYDPFTPLVVAGAIYWAMVQLVQLSFDRLERSLAMPGWKTDHAPETTTARRSAVERDIDLHRSVAPVWRQRRAQGCLPPLQAETPVESGEKLEWPGLVRTHRDLPNRSSSAAIVTSATPDRSCLEVSPNRCAVQASGP